MYTKNFDDWVIIKKKSDERIHAPFVRQREIRWTILGVNVGSEIDGKGPSFTRPCLVLHTIGPHLALVVPLSTKIKSVPGYIAFKRKETSLSACIHQMRIVSQKRILKRLGKATHDQFDFIRDQVKKFYNF